MMVGVYVLGGLGIENSGKQRELQNEVIFNKGLTASRNIFQTFIHVFIDLSIYSPIQIFSNTSYRVPNTAGYGHTGSVEQDRSAILQLAQSSGGEKKLKGNFTTRDKDSDGEVQVHTVLYPVLCTWFYAVNVMFTCHMVVIVCDASVIGWLILPFL